MSTRQAVPILFAISLSCCGGPPPKPEPVGRSAASDADASSPKPAAVLPAELVGTFRAAGSLGGSDDDRRMSWMKEYTFEEDGTWTLVGYPPIKQSGTVTVLAREPSRIHLRIDRAATDHDPAFSSDHWIDLRDGGFTIGEETYERVEKRRKR